MYSVSLASLQKILQKINLKHTLSAREGYSASRIFIETLVFENFYHNLIDGVFLSAYLPFKSYIKNRATLENGGAGGSDD